MMNHTILKKIACEVVEAITPLIINRTINIIGEDGYIIASSDLSRIGSFHEGGKIAVDENRIVEIWPDEVNNYKGVKEGINSPIVYEEQVIGAVGIYGKPDEARECAALLSICVALYLKQATYFLNNAKRKEQKSSILELLFTFDKTKAEILKEKIRWFNKKVVFPIVPIFVKVKENTVEYESFKLFLANNGYYNKAQDILFSLNDGFLILKQNYTSKLIATIEEKLDIETLTLLTCANNYEELITSFSVGYKLLKTQTKKIADASKKDDLVQLLLTDEEVRNTVVQESWQKLEVLSSPWVVETMKSFVTQDGRVQCIAQELNIHKNTAIYRLDKILETLDLTTNLKFTQILIMSFMLFSKGGIK